MTYMKEKEPEKEIFDYLVKCKLHGEIGKTNNPEIVMSMIADHYIENRECYENVEVKKIIDPGVIVGFNLP